MLLNREYLHLEEADQVTGLNKFDLIEMFHRDQIKLYCWCNENRLFAEGKYKGDEQPSILGSFSYIGAVGITKDKINDLLTKQKPVKAQRFIIKQPDNIDNWTDQGPKILDYPNKKYIQYKHCKKIDFNFWSFIDATTASKTEGAKAIGKLFDSFLKNPHMSKDSESIEQFKQTKQEFRQHYDNEVSYKNKEFYPTDLRFCKSEVLAIIKPSTALAPKPLNSKAPSPLDEIILDIIESEGGRSDHIWNTLRTESKKEIMDRIFDKYGVIEEISPTAIVWTDRANETQTLSRKSFINKIYRIKKKHGLE